MTKIRARIVGLSCIVGALVAIATTSTRAADPIYVFTHFAGSGSISEPGAIDGTGTATRFRYSTGAAVDASGNLYIADSGNYVIRKITPSGIVTTIAGSAGQSGSADGAGAAARFNSLAGVTLDSAANIYVVDGGNYTIRKITPSGEVSTFAGLALHAGGTDGLGDAARFDSPDGIAADDAGNIYVSEQSAHRIRKITSAGLVTTFAGSTGVIGSADGTGVSATFNYPAGMAVDRASGEIYVADSFNNTIRKITPSGVVTTFAGTAGQSGDQDGQGVAARFDIPLSVAVDAFGNVYVGERSSIIRKITPSGAVTTIGGAYRQQGNQEGAGNNARFIWPLGIAIDGAGTIYFTDYGNHSVRRGVIPSITWTQPSNITYGTAVSALQLNAVANLGGSYSYSVNPGDVLNAGSHSLGVSFSMAVAPELPALTAQTTLSVDKALLTVTATDQTKIEGQPNPILTFEAAGYKNGETITVIDTLPVTTTIANDVSTAGLYPIVVSGGSDNNYSFTFVNGTLTIVEYTASPIFSLQPMAQSTTAGSGAEFRVTATGTPSPSYQWQSSFDGGGTWTNLANSGIYSGVTTATLSIARTDVAMTGYLYRVVVRNNLGTSVSAGAVLTVLAGKTARLVNLASRAYCSTGNNVTIGGFVVAGPAPKRLLIRAVGPSLTASGIATSEVLLDPTIEVHDANHGNAVVATNDNWADNNNAVELTMTASTLGATPLLGTDTRSAALLLTLAPGVYSFVVNSKGATSGIVLLELYDADVTNSGSTFVNIATRAYSSFGNKVTIGGFVVSGAPRTILMRAVGSTLAKFGVPSTELLLDPTIVLHDAARANAIIATNDNWGDNDNAALITSIGARIGATALDVNDTKSSALLVKLDPGIYTFVASGKSDTSGIVLVEVYDAE